MTGHDQFREGIKEAIAAGCFSDDFETHPVGTAKRLRDLETEVRRLQYLTRSMRDAVGPVAPETEYNA